MNRLQKKCFIASAGLHLLLVLILLIGPAFLSSSSKTEDVQTIDFIPLITTDANMSGGGNPKGGSPPAQPQKAPQPPAPAPPEPPVAEKTPEVKTEKITKPEPEKIEKTPDPESLEIAKPKKHKIEVSTEMVTRNNAADIAKEKAKARAAAEARAARAEAERQQRIASALSGAVSSLSGNFSGATSIELKGPGGGGIPYGNWLAGVKARYTDAWIVPDGVNDDSATVTVTVTIARDGEVLSSSVVRSSGNDLVDESVRATLKRVREVPPLPEGAKEDKRTVTINFNVKAKQGYG
jgi:TonB family protein